MTAQDDKDALWRILLAEFIGTFVLVFVDAGGAVVADLAGEDEVTAEARALAAGLTVMAMIFSFGHLSGAHINPAVTLAFYIRGVFPLRHVAAYWLAQIGGAVLAALTLRALFGSSVGASVNRPELGVTPAFGMEVALTTILILVILSTAQRLKVTGPNAAIPVGGTVALCSIIGRPVSSAAMNPARAIGPAIVAWQFEHLWIYIAAPALGALIAALIVYAVHGHKNAAEREAAQGGKDPNK